MRIIEGSHVQFLVKLCCCRVFESLVVSWAPRMIYLSRLKTLLSFHYTASFLFGSCILVIPMLASKFDIRVSWSTKYSWGLKFRSNSIEELIIYLFKFRGSSLYPRWFGFQPMEHRHLRARLAQDKFTSRTGATHVSQPEIVGWLVGWNVIWWRVSG